MSACGWCRQGLIVGIGVRIKGAGRGVRIWAGSGSNQIIGGGTIRIPLGTDGIGWIGRSYRHVDAGSSDHGEIGISKG